MEFELTEDQVMLRDSVRRLVAREYTFQRRQTYLASAHGSSPEIWRLLAQRGIFGLGLPEDAGGHGGSIEIMLVMEELGRGLVLEPFLSTVVLGGTLIRDHGTVMQRAVLLPKIAIGALRSALAHQEAGARYVLDHVSTTARRGNGLYFLNGSKAVVLDAPLADVLIVSARDEAAGGLSLFMVGPNAAGVKTTVYRTRDGRSAADVVLDNVQVPTAARLGAPGVALNALEQAVDCALAALCAEAVGVIDALNESTLRYLNTGKRFDRFVMALQARSMSCLASVRCRERDRSERHRALSAAQACMIEATRLAGQQALQLQGEIGMSAQLAINHYCRRLTVIDAQLSTWSHGAAQPNLAQA
jgi:alkylation response protein AidB-like acyl-CoA dehydrogenase